MLSISSGLGVGQIAKFRGWYTHCIVVYISWSMRSPLHRLKVRGMSYSVLTVALWLVLVSQSLRVTFCFQSRSPRRPTQSNVGTSDCRIFSDNVPSLWGAIIDSAGATNAKSQKFRSIQMIKNATSYHNCNRILFLALRRKTWLVGMKE
jgi:hypothetical protein